ncbi:MAG: polysaccharide export outer membrane protein [Pirellulaceae bacterium]|jgi:polysaccharide export outer membrane protein
MMHRLQNISGSYVTCTLALLAAFGITHLYLQYEQMESEPLLVRYADQVHVDLLELKTELVEPAKLTPFGPPIDPPVLDEIPQYPAVFRIGQLPADEQRRANSSIEGAPIAATDVDPDSFKVQLCQYNGAVPYVPPGTWDLWNQGNYTGPARQVHVGKYRLRVQDQLEFFFRLTREITSKPYELSPGDEITIDFSNDQEAKLNLTRDVIVQPNGTITLKLVGPVAAAGMTLPELQAKLEKRYETWIPIPSITVSPKSLNAKLEELRAVYDRRAGVGGQALGATVTPEGTIQLPSIGSVFVQGLTLDELTREIGARYGLIVDGAEITAKLVQRAPTSIYVLGEVAAPDRYAITDPTSVIDAIALAQGWNPGGNLRNVIVFRRTEDWGIIATRVDIHDALYGNDATPRDNIYLRHLDTIVIPKRQIQVTNDWINLIFTRGIYSVIPLQYTVAFMKNSTI